MTLQAETRALPEGGWTRWPVAGVAALTYRDAFGARTVRRVALEEVRVGLGKVLLIGRDVAIDAHRGFRADRIEKLVDEATGEAVERNVVDWILRRASAKRPKTGIGPRLAPVVEPAVPAPAVTTANAAPRAAEPAAKRLDLASRPARPVPKPSAAKRRRTG